MKGAAMNTVTRERAWHWLPWAAVAALCFCLFNPMLRSEAQQPSSVDQIAPVLHGRETFAEMMAKDKAEKESVMARQKKVLEERYDRTPRPDAKLTMSRGKPIPVGSNPQKKDSGASSDDQISPVLRGQVTFAQMMATYKADKESVMARQRRLLEERYDLTPRPDAKLTMSRGKPIPVGPTAKLPEGITWDQLGAMSCEEIRDKGVFPKGFLPLPHPKHEAGGMVFPQMEIEQFGRLKRFDVDFDLPDHFLPEFPPAVFLTTRPDLGDVSQGMVVTKDNFQKLFEGILNASDLKGLGLLVTQFPQQQFNDTPDRMTERPDGMKGVACFDCHVNGHTSGATTLVNDVRPHSHRRRVDTRSLRGVNSQTRFGSQRALRTIVDFTEFEQRAVYFDGDQVSASASASQVHLMSEFQELLDFPPAPGLRWDGKLDSKKFAVDSPEMKGQTLFFGKAQCATCHPAPYYTDNTLHDLQVDRFYKTQMINGLVATKQGPIKTFTLRGIKDSPPYFHDGRLLTLEDTVEFFNLVLESKLTDEEKEQLVAFLRQL
jgi:cytochrome c peroxidase